MSEWQAYFPDDDETAEDATTIIMSVNDAEWAAQEAAEFDFCNRDGWERMQSEFAIVVISPDGQEFKFKAFHEPSVVHFVEPDE